MERGYAASLAVPLWARFMTVVTRGDAPEPFRIPSSVRPVTICRISGRLATDRCRNDSTAATEYFVAGSEPTAYCHAHDQPSYQEVLFDQDAPLDAPPLFVPGALGTTGPDPSLEPPAIPPPPMPPTEPMPPPPPPPIAAPAPERAKPIQPVPPIEDPIVPPPPVAPGG